MEKYNTTRYLLLVTLFLLLDGCKSDKQTDPLDQYAYNLGVVGGFSELINAGVKQLALSAPLTPGEMDAFIDDARDIASKHEVSIYRESDLIVTDLFPADVAMGKDVLLLFNGTTQKEYQALKADKTGLENAGAYNGVARVEIARRFGRMLSYSPKKINQLLSQNTDFRTMSDFGIRANNLFLYYKDLEKAGDFYSKTLGMEQVGDYGMALIFRMTLDSYLILVDANAGMHTAEEPKTVALALLTEQLEEWYTYLKGENVEFKYEYQPEEKSAHDGFVVVDPEGYLLEFEKFNQHPENERFVPILTQNKTTTIHSDHEHTVPDGLGIHSTITWLYYKDVLAMQHYYQDIFGLEMVADQGWTKIYRASNTGFLAIVDERRGMHSFTEKKAVNVGFIIDDVIPWFAYAKENKLFKLYDEELGIDPETRYKSFVGFGPEGYYIEFDRFYPHEDNTLLLKYLNSEE